MTVISRIILIGYTLIFGRVVVQDKYIDRSRRMLRSALTEQEQELLNDPRRGLSATYKRQAPWAERLSDRVCDMLVQEAYQRAAAIASDGSVRWSGFLAALFEVSNVTGKALDGEKIADLRVKQILEINRVI